MTAALRRAGGLSGRRSDSPSRWIRPEHADHFGHLFEPVERARDARVVELPDEIEIERVLPRTSFDRPRLDLREIDLEDGESAERAKQRAGLVRGSENNRGLPPTRSLARHDLAYAAGR